MFECVLSKSSGAGAGTLRALCSAYQILESARPNAALLFELHYFGRFGIRAIALAIGEPERACLTQLRFARAWLLRAASCNSQRGAPEQ